MFESFVQIIGFGLAVAAGIFVVVMSAGLAVVLVAKIADKYL